MPLRSCGSLKICEGETPRHRQNGRPNPNSTPPTATPSSDPVDHCSPTFVRTVTRSVRNSEYDPSSGTLAARNHGGMSAITTRPSTSRSKLRGSHPSYAQATTAPRRRAST